jgi:hypothetical protein
MRSLVPREHGAYVQLFAPLLAALLIRMPSISAILIAIAATSAFFGSEALLVLRGGRGVRRREQDSGRASKRVRQLGLLAIGTATIGFVLAPTAAALAAAVMLPATGVLILATRRRVHTISGELLAAISLAGAAVPVAAASGVPIHETLALWMAWGAGFATTVVAVHGVLRRRRTHIELVAAVVTLGVAAWMYPLAAVALPLAIASAVVSFARPHARRLTVVGISLAIASTVSMLIATIAV